MSSCKCFKEKTPFVFCLHEKASLNWTPPSKWLVGTLAHKCSCKRFLGQTFLVFCSHGWLAHKYCWLVYDNCFHTS